MWTKFFDMSSGGGTKVFIDGKGKDYIFIELPEADAISYFEQRFGRDPNNVTCNCCGEDYSINGYKTLEDATRYNRQDWRTNEFHSTVDEYAKRMTNTSFVKRTLQISKTTTVRRERLVILV